MSENLEDLTPNQRRALNKGLAALETMAAMWGAEIRIHDVAQKLAAKPQADRAKSIAAFIEQAFIEGAYRHYLDRDPAANPELERVSQPGSGEAEYERAAFHSFVNGAGGHTMRRADGSYVSSMTELWWKCWKARASLDGRS